MTHRIADTFYKALAALTHEEQKAAKLAVFDFQENPSLPALSLHRVDRARDPNFWTARVNRDIRMVIHKADGDDLLAWVGHHDDAYRWAETRRIESHPTTGAIQIVETRETAEDVVTRSVPDEAPALPAPLEHEHDATLLGWGVPEDWLDTVRAADEDALLDIAQRLPGEAQDALLAAAAGERPSPLPTVKAGQDPWAHPDALRRFRVVDGIDEMRAALDAPWETWTVFLHPAQREYVDRDFAGPARVIGSAGTGKTIVALHRAVRLARDPDASVLLTTFNRRLAGVLADKLALVAPGPVRARIKVEPLDAVIHRLHDALFGSAEIVDESTLREYLGDAAAAEGLTADPDFLFDEWRLIVDAWAVADADTYREMPRLGRKLRMAAARRDALWAVFARVRDRLAAEGLTTEAAMAHRLRGTPFPFTHVVIDEAQDVAVPELLFLADAVRDRPNGLFFAGDIGQRIFRPPFPWSAAGIELRGRSRNLKVNYRTSHQIRARSDTLLPETLVEADGSEASRLGVTSVFDGPAPEIGVFADETAERAALVAWIDGLLDEGIDPDEIVILVRSRDAAQRFTHPGIETIQMHDAKGSEYRCVAVAGLTHDALPDKRRLLAARDEAAMDEVMATERHLLYVAATRARDRLWLSGTAPASDFLTDLIAEG